MTDQVQPQNFPQESVSVTPIVNTDSMGNQYRYFKIENGEFKNVVFTVTEVDFVKKSDLPDYDPSEGDPDEMTATGRIVFENTVKFTSSSILNSPVFGAIARDVFDKVVAEIKEGIDKNNQAEEAEKDE